MTLRGKNGAANPLQRTRRLPQAGKEMAPWDGPSRRFPTTPSNPSPKDDRLAALEAGALLGLGKGTAARFLPAENRRGRRPVGSPARPAGPGRFRGRPARGARGNAPRPLQGRGKTGERNAAQAWVATARVLLTGGRTAPAAPRIRPGSRERRRARRAWREGPR